MSGPLVAFLAGFGLSASFILAIGAQNAFVLRQGLRGEHVFVVVAICCLSEVILIATGVGGLALIVAQAPWIRPVFTWAGAAFLIAYGIRSLVSARRGGDALMPSQERAGSLKSAVVTCLALTWLNPHVYLDTVFLLGSISAEYDAPWVFGAGAATASILFFVALGYGARLLAPFFARPRSWQLLEAFVGVTMLAIAAKLLLT